MNEYKIIANNESEARRILDAFFALGGYWKHGRKVHQRYQNLDAKYFFYSVDGTITSTDNFGVSYKGSMKKEITLEDLEKKAGTRQESLIFNTI